jgi:hypothetical protein
MESLLNIEKAIDETMVDRFLTDLIAIAEIVKQKKIAIRTDELIDGLMIYYSKANRPTALRRRQGRRSYLDN